MLLFNHVWLVTQQLQQQKQQQKLCNKFDAITNNNKNCH